MPISRTGSSTSRSAPERHCSHSHANAHCVAQCESYVSLRDLPLHGGMVVADVDGPELFAVASELFFERPMTLMRIDPELFYELQNIYKIDTRLFV
jgi:hypothetical protein